jgi:hypothetical protein
MSDWWSQRLGGQPAPPKAQPQQPQGQWVYQPAGAPAGYQQQQAPYAQQQPPPGPPKVTMHNLIESMGHWAGGEGARSSHRCPGCGSPHLFERGGQNAPQCYECGWNPRFASQGLPRG